MKIGDRVKVIAECDGKKSIIGQIGTIISIGQRVNVQFDNNICGHNGNGIGKVRHCWLVDLHKLKVLQTWGDEKMSKDIQDAEIKSVNNRSLFEVFANELILV
jgi:hypothetical protein